MNNLITKFTLAAGMLGYLMGLTLGPSALYASDSFADRIVNPNADILDIRDELNDTTAFKRGEVLLELSEKFLLGDNEIAKSQLASLGCRMKGWSLPEANAIILQNMLFEYSRIEAAKKKNFDFRNAACAALSRAINGRGIYFGSITTRDEILSTQICSGKLHIYGDTDRLIGELDAVLRLFDYEKDTAANSSYFNYYPLAIKLRKANIHAQAAARSRSEEEQERELRNAIEIYQGVLDDLERLQNTRHGWRLYPAFLVFSMIYRSALDDENAIYQIKTLGDLAPKEREFCAQPYEDSGEPICENFPGIWPTAVETHNGDFDHLPEGFPFEKVEIIENDLLDPQSSFFVDESYVALVNVVRFFPGAQEEMADECQGWKRRSYNPNQIIAQAASCQDKLNSLREFDACLNALEAKDWLVQFATYNKSQIDLAKTLATKLNKAFQREPFRPFFVGSKRKVIALETSLGKVIVYVDQADFSTSEVSDLRRLMNGDFLRSNNLPLPLFKRPPQR